MDLFKVKQDELQPSLRNCFILAMARFYQLKKLTTMQGEELLTTIKDLFVINNEVDEQGRLFVHITQAAQSLIANHTVELLAVNKITYENIKYLQEVAEVIYVFQLCQKDNGKQYSHHETLYTYDILNSHLDENAIYTHFHIIQKK